MEQINKLEIINELSKHIVSTIETKQVFSLLNAAFQNALEADAYYIGIVDEDDLRLELFYDDGEFYENIKLNRKGTLSNWVIKNQKELFLPDLRQDLKLDDVELILIGKKKTTLSWMGVPMRGSHVDGVMAISSYRPNAFDRSDMELLSAIVNAPRWHWTTPIITPSSNRKASSTALPAFTTMDILFKNQRTS